MLSTKEIKIKIPNEITSEYIENELLNMGFNVIYWSITDCNDDIYTLNVSVEE